MRKGGGVEKDLFVGSLHNISAHEDPKKLPKTNHNSAESQNFESFSLFVDGDEHFPSSYPQTITGLNPGQTYSFFVRAEQFGKTTQSPPIEITMPGGDLSLQILFSYLSALKCGSHVLFSNEFE